MFTQSFRKLPQERLTRLLQNAHAGELAAFYAYEGHARSVFDPTEVSEIRKIQTEEWEHRECVARMLRTLGAGPDRTREFVFFCVGKTIGALCLIGGWFVPMYGAGRLESKNIAEYEVAARVAFEAGHLELVEDLVRMAEVEWDHEFYFRGKAQTHWLWRLVPKWTVPPPRAQIRLAAPRAATAKVPV